MANRSGSLTTAKKICSTCGEEKTLKRGFYRSYNPLHKDGYKKNLHYLNQIAKNLEKKYDIYHSHKQIIHHASFHQFHSKVKKMAFVLNTWSKPPSLDQSQ